MNRSTPGFSSKHTVIFFFGAGGKEATRKCIISGSSMLDFEKHLKLDSFTDSDAFFIFAKYVIR